MSTLDGTIQALLQSERCWRVSVNSGTHLLALAPGCNQSIIHEPGVRIVHPLDELANFRGGCSSGSSQAFIEVPDHRAPDLGPFEPPCIRDSSNSVSIRARP